VEGRTGGPGCSRERKSELCLRAGCNLFRLFCLCSKAQPYLTNVLEKARALKSVLGLLREEDSETGPVSVEQNEEETVSTQTKHKYAFL
jgi:hypothetical protein